ncbi:hypothetical protein OIU84_005118 [Salix udensis]|uniref:Uncharacterized protein n=1 Tax=Salix udensis TaxID=889485 RepID=A0AAD6JVC5_9ROSI|nr:hypothetical protein OIU84_005118 [Salix udensis]
MSRLESNLVSTHQEYIYKCNFATKASRALDGKIKYAQQTLIDSIW